MAFSLYRNQYIETMPIEQIKEMQLWLLKKQLGYVLAHSPFYQRKWDEVGLRLEHIKKLDDLKNVPFTEKDELRQSQIQNPPLGDYACVPLENVVRVHSSSGTTGRPSFIGLTDSDKAGWTEIAARCFWCEGLRPTDRLAFAMGLGFFTGGLPPLSGLETIGVTCFPIGTGASDRVVLTIKEMKADNLLCTPSYAIYLADWIKRRGEDPATLGLKLISVGAESGGGEGPMRQRIEDLWGCRVIEGCGNSDMAPVYGAECPERKGNHLVCPDFIYLELIDPETGDSIPIEDRAEGEFVSTHLARECNPLIRMRTHDKVKVFTEPCQCGRTGFRLKIIGRTDDMLIALGVNIWPTAVKDVITSMRPRLTGDMQIVLKEPGPKVEPPVWIQAEYPPGTKEKDLPNLKKECEATIRERLIFSANIELVPEGTLPKFELKSQLIRKLWESSP